MRAAILTRISKDRNASSRSPEQQEVECRAEAARHGWTVVRVFTERDRSASRYAKGSRPEFERLREFIDAGECDVLLTWEASRSTRDLATFVPLRDLCRTRGVKLSYSGRTLDLSEATDQFQAGLDALLAEQESARSSSRIKRSVRANAVEGRPHGKNLYGYRRAYDPDTRKLISIDLVESEAAIIRECARRILEGDSLRSIAQDLNDAGHRTRADAPWTSLAVRRAVTNPSYVGRRMLNGEVVATAMWSPILDDETFDAVRALLSNPHRYTARGNHNPAHLLTGIALCGVPDCSGRMRAVAVRSMYTCAACGGASRKQEPVDTLVIDVLLKGLEDPRNAAALLGHHSEPGRSAGSRHAASAAEKRARLETFYDAAASGEITAAALARIETRLLAEIADLERNAPRRDVPPLLRKLVPSQIPQAWDGLSLEVQRELVRHFLRVVILPTGRTGRYGFSDESVRISWNQLWRSE